MLVNTPFNVRGEPVFCWPRDIFRCFMGAELGVLAIDDCSLFKDEQDPGPWQDYE